MVKGNACPVCRVIRDGYLRLETPLISNGTPDHRSGIS
jgi:hypothetical protein